MARYTMRPSRGVSAITAVAGLVLGVVGLAYFGNRLSAGGSAVPLAGC